MKTAIIGTRILSADLKRARWQTMKAQLLLLEREGLLQKGYTKRVANGNIKYHTVVTKINELYPRSPYQVKARKVKNTNMLFVTKHVMELPGM